MKLRKSIIAAALALAGFASGAAQAVPYSGSFNTGAGFDGLLAPVSGFDIFSNGAGAFFCSSAGGCGGGSIAFGQQLNPASVSPGVVVGDLVTTLYQGVTNVINPGIASPNLVFPGSSNPGTGLYQITVAATFTELVIAANSVTGTATLLPLDGGRVSLFYDSNGGGGLPGTFINSAGTIAAGVGYTDGLLIADGTVSQVSSLLTNVSANGTNASGSANVNGPLNFAQVGSIIPDVVGFIPPPGDFESTTTLQFGPNTTGYQTSNFFDNANGWTAVAVNAALTERADGNVDLSAVPEPGTLSLLGVALAGIGMIQRRRAA